MIKLNIQLFGGSKSSASVEDVKDRTQGKVSGGSHYVGKVNAETKAGKLYDNNVWDLAASGKSNKEVRADIQKYFGAQGVTDVKEKLASKYHNTLHVIESKDDKGNKMMYVVHVGSDGSMRVSEPKESQRVLNHLEAMYANGELSDTDNGYFKGANKVNGTVEWGALPPPAGQDASGKAVYVSEGGNVVDKNGNSVDEFVDNDGDTLIKDGIGEFVKPDGEKKPVTAPPKDNSKAVEDAFNQYYNDLYSREDGTLGRDIFDNNLSLFEKEAHNAEMLADASLQQSVLAQADGIKQATNAIKSERMAQLRSGMSAAQLADRELQMLMGTQQAFAGQAANAAQERMAAALGANTAREMAFNQYIDQTTALGQNASANYASEAGDLLTKAREYQQQMKNQGNNISLEDSLLQMSGQQKQ